MSAPTLDTVDFNAPDFSYADYLDNQAATIATRIADSRGTGEDARYEEIMDDRGYDRAQAAMARYDARY